MSLFKIAERERAASATQVTERSRSRIEILPFQSLLRDVPWLLLRSSRPRPFIKRAHSRRSRLQGPRFRVGQTGIRQVSDQGVPQVRRRREIPRQTMSKCSVDFDDPQINYALPSVRCPVDVGFGNPRLGKEQVHCNVSTYSVSSPVNL